MSAVPEIVERKHIAAGSSGVGAVAAPARVFVMDLLSVVPYYTAELCAALGRRPELELEVGAITYYLDRGCFKSVNVSFARGLLDLASKLRGLPRVLRRVLKTAEYLLNLLTLSVRFALRPPDLLHVQFLPLMSLGLTAELLFLRMLQRRGVQIIYTVHNVLPHESPDRHRALYQQVYDCADRLICHDRAARESLVGEFQQDPRRIEVIPHGPLLAPPGNLDSRAARLRLNLPAHECIILWQGILRPYKGVTFLLEAWKLFRVQNRLPARLVIAGGGDALLEQEIRERVTILGLADSVRLDLRFVSVAELRDLHTAADILVYPYSEATTSGALMTGLGYGKAVLASRLPVFEHVLREGENALLARYGDASEFGHQLNRLVSDFALRRRLGASLRESSANSPDWDHIAAQTTLCYQSLLDRRSRRR